MSSIRVANPALYRVLERWSIYFTTCVMVIALAVLAGWQWDIGLLRRPVSGLVAMNPVTALSFLLSAIAFLAIRFGKPRSAQWKAGRFAAGAVVCAGLAVLCGYLFPSLEGVDHLLYPERLRVDGIGQVSNRMAINSACCFVLVGICLFQLRPSAARGAGETTRRRWFPAEGAALLIGTLGLLSLIGYLYGAKEYYGFLRYYPMAVHSAWCFLLLALSLLLTNPERGIMGVLTGTLSGSLMARRLLPFAFLVPIVLGELRLLGYWKGYLSTELGVTLLVLSIILCFVFVVWYNALLLNRRDAQAEAELNASESRWETVISSVKDYAIFLLDPEGRVMTWNESAARIKGYRPEEIIGQPIAVFYTPEEIERDEPRLNLEAAAATGSHSSAGWRVRKDGSRFWAEIVFTAIYDQQHRLQAFAKITRDRTEQKIAQEKIAYFARLIEDTSDAIFSTDSKGAINTWNRAAESLFGYSAAEVIGRPATDLMRPQMSEDVQEPIRRQLEEKGYWKGEIVYQDSGGEKHTILQSVSDTRDAEGNPGGYVIVGRDVTQWKKVEEQLRQFNISLEAQVMEKTAEISQSNEELRALAKHLQDIREEERAAMAREVHDELGQQLTGLKMDLALMARKIPVESKEWLLAQTQTTLALVDDTIRTVRKMASELRPSILDDLGLVAALDWQGQEFMKRSGISTSFHSNQPGIELPAAVSIGLFRICQESLTNVARHSGAKKVGITLAWETARVSLVICDDGRGIDLQQQDKNGKTLGLLGMKERALMMGGTLTIDSRPGAGVTLAVTVPIDTEPKP
jgi:PAS domain S-box-containing protein